MQDQDSNLRPAD